MKRLALRYLKPYYGRMGAGFIIKFIGTIMDLCIPYILAYIIDYVIPGGERQPVLLWGSLMIFCSILAVSFNIAANRMASKVAGDATEIIRRDLFAKIMGLSATQTDKYTKPSLISRMTSDTYNVQQMLGRMQRLGVRAPILLLGGICVTFTLDIPMACVLLATLPLLAFITVYVSKRSILMFSDLQESTDCFVRIVREDIAGIRVIKALSKTDYETEKFRAINREVVEREKKNGMVMAIINPSMNVLLNLGSVGVIFVGACRVNTGLSEVGKILAFTTYFTIILNAVMSISKMFSVFSKAIASGNRIWEVLECEEDMRLLEQCVDKNYGEDTACKICFEDVSFSYLKEGEANLKNLSFHIKKGETLGIIGEIGSGKSTIVNLLMRFYDADRGEILVDGKRVKELTRTSLREAYAMVLQDTWLFHGSIYENLSYGKEGATKEEVEAAARAAHIHSFIKRLPQGYDTILTDEGTNISKGQKQLLTIARAMLLDAKMLILDEATSNVDTRTEQQIQKAMRKLMEGKTCFVIAHRLSTIENADLILAVNKGEVVEQGTHRELMQRGGMYKRLYEAQFE